MAIDERTKSRILQKQRSYANATQNALNLTDYEAEIAYFSKVELLKEQEKLKNKLNLQYIVIDPQLPRYSVQKINIAEDIEQKNRVWLRKNVSFATVILQGLLNDIGVASEEFSGFMGYIRDQFLKSINVPQYAEVGLAGKSVPMADKLSMIGLKAFRRYLLFLCDNLEHSCYVKGGNSSMDFTIAVADALVKEMEVDDNLNRDNIS